MNLKELIYSMPDDEEKVEIATPAPSPVKMEKKKTAYTSVQKPKIVKQPVQEPEEDEIEDDNYEEEPRVIRKQKREVPLSQSSQSSHALDSAMEKYSKLEALLNGEKELSVKREEELRKQMKILEEKLENSLTINKQEYNRNLQNVKRGIHF